MTPELDALCVALVRDYVAEHTIIQPGQGSRLLEEMRAIAAHPDFPKLADPDKAAVREILRSYSWTYPETNADSNWDHAGYVSNLALAAYRAGRDAARGGVA